jgi:predicted neuraminidase
MNRTFLPFAFCLLIFALAAPLYGAARFQAELIFPLEKWHNHGSSIVELPNGDLLVSWYHGSGERSADDVIIEAARKVKGESAWRPRFLLADTPGFPDCNSVLYVDARKRLWLLWPLIVANEWHTAITRYKISSDYQDPRRPPRWEVNENLLLKPDLAGPVNAAYEKLPKPVAESDDPRLHAYIAQIKERAADKYFSRMGWMPRAHPVTLPSGRIIVPLYSDGYSFSIMALSDDGGETWKASAPLVGGGSIQPAIARRNDGTLFAYMRDNGPPPKRIHLSTSSDDGITWTIPVDTDLPNPGSACEVLRLRNGLWALVYNDTERGRNSLAISLSDDEGKSWKWTRHIERERAGSYHYPSIIEGADGTLHVSYSYFVEQGKAIKHAAFNVEWVKAGDPQP